MILLEIFFLINGITQNAACTTSTWNLLNSSKLSHFTIIQFSDEFHVLFVRSVIFRFPHSNLPPGPKVDISKIKLNFATQ